MPCSRPFETPPKRGITLIEVVVGLVLLSTLLTVILISTGKLHRQQKAAIQKLEAVHLLDELTAEFFRKGFPNLDSVGPIESQPDRYWQVTGQPSPIGPDRLVSVRLSILGSSPNQSQANLRATSDPSNATDRRLATLEILVSRDFIGRYKK
jgi:type II secretory pathway pseudopilin PulG